MTEIEQGLLLTPPEDGAPEEFGPLTQDEREQFAHLRAVVLNEIEGSRVAVMRVMHDGRPRAAVCVVGETEEGELFVSPIALLMDASLFEGMHAPPGGVRVPPVVQKDDDVEPDTVILLLTLVDDEFDVALDDLSVGSWSQSTLREVRDWATAVHLRASDNDDVVIPPMPEVLRLPL